VAVTTTGTLMKGLVSLATREVICQVSVAVRVAAAPESFESSPEHATRNTRPHRTKKLRYFFMVAVPLPVTVFRRRS
jgi:hypothetical protein